MSSIVKRPNGRWAVVYRMTDPATGRPRQVWKSGFLTEREAKAFRTDTDKAVKDGTHAVPTRMTLKDYIEGSWLPSIEARPKLRPSTVAQYRTLALTQVVPRIGGLLLQEVRADRLDRLYGELAVNGRRNGKGGLSPTSIHAVHVTLSKMLGDAVDLGLIATNPATRCKAVPRPARTEMTVWSGEQLRTFLKSVADDRLYAMWITLALTGMRRGEIAGLRWSDLDLDAGRLTVAQTRSSVDYAVVVGEPKTEKGRRTIGLDPVTVAALKTHRAGQATERLAWGPAWTDAGLVFVREDGTPFHPDRIRLQFHARTKTAGLPQIRVHDLRHSYATAALEAGEPLKVVADRLGHASIAITGDLYSHVRQEVDAKAADNVAAFLLGATS